MVYTTKVKPHLGNIRIVRMHSYDIDNVIQGIMPSTRAMLVVGIIPGHPLLIANGDLYWFIVEGDE